VTGVAGEIDPKGRRKDALDAFSETKLQEGFEIETHTETHAIVVEKQSFPGRLRGPGAAKRYVVSVETTTKRAARARVASRERERLSLPRTHAHA
jgi:hypothetical protein